MTKTLLAIGVAGLMGTAALAVDQPTKSGCPKKAKAPSSESAQAQKVRCSLTGKVVDKCCCVEREGWTHCTLADKDVASCCCRPVREDVKKS